MLKLTYPPSGAARAKTSQRQQVTDIQRQTLFTGIIEDAGGIVDESELFNTLAVQNKQRDEWVMDRKTFLKAVDHLVGRGVVKRTKMTLDNLGRTQPRIIVYRTDIDIGSTQMAEFLRNLRSRVLAPVGRPQQRRDVGELDVGSGFPSPRTSGQKAKAKLPLDAAPEATREYFAAEWRIVAQHYGFIYGRFARARFFHLHLLRDIPKSDSPNIVSRTGQRILRVNFFYEDLPLETYMRVIPSSILAPELDAALSDPILAQTPIANLPPNVLSALSPKRSKDRAKMANVLEILSELKALVGLVPASSDPSVASVSVPYGQDSILCEETKDVTRAEYWLVPERAPVYSFSRDLPEKPIIGVCGLHDGEEGTLFWDKVEMASLGRGFQTVPVTDIADHGFPPTFAGSKQLATTANVLSKWQVDYFMLSRQRTYLSRLWRRGDLDREDEGNLRRLSELTLAPVEAIRSFLQQPTVPYERKKRRTRTEEERSAIKIARKAKNASRQREKDWDALIKRFHDTSDGIELDARTHDLLRDWFVAPNGINVAQLNEHLSTWLMFQRESRADQSIPSDGRPDPTSRFHQALLELERSEKTGKRLKRRRVGKNASIPSEASAARPALAPPDAHLPLITADRELPICVLDSFDIYQSLQNYRRPAVRRASVTGTHWRKTSFSKMLSS
jgi:hypothetical protein